ncbi:DUF2061 domain-containing protein [Lysobacter sp. Root494]|uniref:DUF2061 domain-containing protein n=1 Tax=Lysobacter sp. Root494 TaxID=1736549 RepID=UPI000701BDD0|nr:DUF2061 domain-containing protein [Lysobacter sp. Root494]KQY50418.1 hypothetical protein ASD14_11915 [Lysobacter sp. Root494]
MAKAFGFAIVHFSVAFAVGYLMTGSALIGGTLALVEPVCNAIAFHFHEKPWKRMGGLRVQSITSRDRITIAA